MTTKSNGIKLMTKIVGLAEQRPVTAIILGLITVSLFVGSISFGTSFLGTGFGMSSEVAKELALLKGKDTYLLSAIEAVQKDHIEDMVRFKEDGKHQSKAEIQLQIKEELDAFEQKLLTRFNLRD